MVGKVKPTSDMFRNRLQVDVAVQVRLLSYALQFSWIVFFVLKTMDDECQTKCGT